MRVHVFSALALMLLQPVFADGPSHDDFLAELIAPAETKMTAHFHSYYENGFAFDKFAVLNTFTKYTRKEDLQPVGLIVVGPLGPMWAYHTITLIKENGMVRANALAMPHGRITFKASALLPETEAKQFLDFMDSSPLLADRGQTVQQIDASLPKEEDGMGEYRFNVLYIRYLPDGPVVRIGDIPRAEQTVDSKALLHRLNTFQGLLAQTYGRSDK